MITYFKQTKLRYNELPGNAARERKAVVSPYHAEIRACKEPYSAVGEKRQIGDDKLWI